MYKLNDISLLDYGIEAGQAPDQNIAIRGIFDLPERMGDTHFEWADTDGVEPYTDADEIILAGRDLVFYGFMEGDRATITANIDNFKAAIAAFIDVVPLETPFGNACVLVKELTTKVYNGGATLRIEFREPQVGAACAVNGNLVTYQSAEYSETAQRNNCESTHYGSEVQFTAVAGQFTSTVSQAAANLLAVQWVRENKQSYANVNGDCIIKPPVFYNGKIEGRLRKNDCGEQQEGTFVTYTVDAFSFSSEVSQADADAQAQAHLDATLTQAYANANGSCQNVGLTFFLPLWGGRRTEGQFTIGKYHIGYGVGGINGEPFSGFGISAYGVERIYWAQPNDGTEEVVIGLVNVINSASQENWHSANAAPFILNDGNKPLATIIEPDKIEIKYLTGYYIRTIVR